LPVVATGASQKGVALRYGNLYGPGSGIGRGGVFPEMLRKRQFPIVGAGTGVWSFLHVDDAASANVAALERGEAGVYNVCDDEPAPLHTWLPVYAEALGAKPPFRAPLLPAKLAAGSFSATMMTKLRGASNAKAKRELGWQPRYPSWRQGFAQALG